MKSFGSLLKEMRGEMQATVLARQAGVPKSYINNVEAGRKVPTEKQALSLLKRGFGLSEEESRRCLLHVLLFDYGVRDERIREVLISFIEQAKLERRPSDVFKRFLELLEREEIGSADPISENERSAE